MEALLRADRFFGVSSSLLQTTQASFLAAFIMAGSAMITFDLFTEEWSRHPLRVQASQEARRLAGTASAAASAVRASALGVFSSKTCRPDGMGMNIAGGYQKMEQDTAALGISADNLVRAKCSDAGFFSAAAGNTRAEDLGACSSKTDRPDGMGMNIAGGYQKVKQDAAALSISADDLVRSKRSDAGVLSAAAGNKGLTAAALLSRGTANATKGAYLLKNPDAVRLCAEIGLYVMGPVTWEAYITTPTPAILVPNRPLGEYTTRNQATVRGSRAGWEFHHASHAGSTWTLDDNITFTLPGHTEENPKWHVETMRAAISETYHIMWKRHQLMMRKDKKDKDAGKKLNRTKAKGNKWEEGRK